MTRRGMNRLRVEDLTFEPKYRNVHTGMVYEWVNFKTGNPNIAKVHTPSGSTYNIRCSHLKELEHA